MLIYGSTAINYWFDDFGSTPKDIDYISKDPKKHTKNKEFYWTDGFQYILDNNKNKKYVDPNFLYTIKCSHAAWDIKWSKTIKHICFLKEKGCKLDKKLFDILYLNWEKIHGKKKVNLSVKNEYFFTNSIYRELDHDKLHNILAFYEKPLHNKIRKDVNSPLPSKDLWELLSYDDKIKCSLEEIYVIATERYLNYPHKTAKLKSMKNLIVSMTKGWFNLFLIENFDTLYYHSDSHWLSKLKEINYEFKRNY